MAGDIPPFPYVIIVQYIMMMRINLYLCFTHSFGGGYGSVVREDTKLMSFWLVIEIH
jgi:hypothetical protein